jgi:hypothetical protein
VKQLQTLRAEYVEWVWRRYYGPDPRNPHLYTLPIRTLDEWVFRPFITTRLVRDLQSWAAMIPLAHPPAEQIALKRAAAFPVVGAALARANFYFINLTYNRCSRTVIAIERYRRDHNGAVPASLQALVPDYLPAVPIDPVDEAPLRYRSTAHVYTVYGVGRDRHDDGGDLSSVTLSAKRPELGVRGTPGRDLGLRVLIR